MRKRPVRLRNSYETGLALAFAGVVIASCATVESPLGPIGDASAPGTAARPQSNVVTIGEGENQYTAARQVSQPDIDCPSVTIRTGAAAWQISAGSGATNVRYQGSLGQLARECAILGDVMTMRVGVEGRLLVGPKGGPGSVNVPLRIALVAEGPQPRPIWSKFYSVPVAVPPNASQAIFSQVEDDLTFPLPPNKKVDNYIVYVGFDPQGAAAAGKGSAKAKAPAPPSAPKASSTKASS
ncbi:MAG: hypothetical protein WD207_03525, partial [Xanthobacteraceae bacterium]